MEPNKITDSRKSAKYAMGLVIFAILLVVAIKFPLPRSRQSPNILTDASNLVAGSLEKFALLSGQSGQRSVGST